MLFCRGLLRRGAAGANNPGLIGYLDGDVRRRIKRFSAGSPPAAVDNGGVLVSSAAPGSHRNRLSSTDPATRVELTMFPKVAPRDDENARRGGRGLSVPALEVVVPLSKAVSRRLADDERRLHLSASVSSGAPSAAGDLAARSSEPSEPWLRTYADVTPLGTRCVAPAPPSPAAVTSPLGDGRGPFDHGSPTYRHALSAARLGDWQLCLQLLNEAILTVGTVAESAANDDAQLTFAFSDAAASQPLEVRCAWSQNLLSFFTVAAAGCLAAAPEDPTAITDGLTKVAAMVCAVAPHLPCFSEEASVEVRSRAYHYLARFATHCKCAAAYGIVLELDRVVVERRGFVVFHDGGGDGTAKMIVPPLAAREWHAALFGVLDELQRAIDGDVPSATPSKSTDSEVMPHTIATAIFSARVGARFGKDDKRDPLGATAVALLAEMLQRRGDDKAAGEVLAHRDLSRDTRAEVSQAYSALIGAWSHGASRRPTMEQTSRDRRPEASGPSWWRPVVAAAEDF